MLENTQGKFTVMGNKVRADGWYGFADGLHTVAIYLNDFQGNLIFQGSIANEPLEDDWFPIEEVGVLSFPADPLNPSGRTGDSGTIGLNITGNFIWLRVCVEREHMGPAPLDERDIASFGYVDRILLNN